MRRLARILWTTFAAASLACCVAAAGVWGRSYFVGDTAEGPIGNLLWTVDTGRGRVAIIRWNATVDPPGDDSRPSWRHAEAAAADSPYDVFVDWGEHRAYPFPGGEYTMQSGGNMPMLRLILHLAYPTALFALPPLAWLVGHRKRRRRAARARAGLCANCAYDLRASPGRCPECGAIRT